MTSTPEQPKVWTYEDLGFLLGSILPCVLLAALLGRLGRMLSPSVVATDSLQGLMFQSWLYVLLLIVLYLLAKRHEQPMWRSLGWIVAFQGAWWCVLLAPILAITISAVGAALRAPLLPSPAEQLLAGKASLLAVGIFSTLIGPAVEELLFRGFLQPLLTQSFLPPVAITLAALPFALLHGTQYQWSWQHLTLVFAAGWVFGLVRHRTGSTAASALMHMGYNLTLLIAYLAQN